MLYLIVAYNAVNALTGADLRDNFRGWTIVAMTRGSPRNGM